MEEDRYQGYEVQKHRAIMTAKMYSQIAVCCLAAQLASLLLLMQLMVPLLHRELALKWPIARLEQMVHVDERFHLHAPGRLLAWQHTSSGIVEMTAQELIRNIAYRRVFTSKEARWGWALLLSFLPWFLCPLMLRFFSKTAVRIKEDAHIRGAKLITEAQIQAGTDGTGILQLGKITIPEMLSRRHLLIAGQTGSGKSTVLIQHLDAIQRAGRRAVANDFKGELLERFYRKEHDLILNPLDTRGVGWTLFNELKSKPDLTAIAGSLIPQAKGEDRFWSQAAQDVLRGVMAYCFQFDKRSNAQLWQAITAPIKDVAQMCRATDSGRAGYSYIQDAGSKQAAGVIAVLMSYVCWLEFATDGTFSLRQWADNASGSTIFITNTEEVSNIMRPYLSLFADLAGKRFLTLPENSGVDKSIYLMLDEMGNMQRLPTVKRLLTAGRSKGIVVEIGIPDFSSLESIYGREDAHTIINSCGSKFIMNLGDPEAAKLFSDLASEEDYWEGSTMYSISQDDNKGGENYSRQIRTRKVVMPAQIMRLPVGQGYFLLPGGNPALIDVPWTSSNHRPKINPAFILRPGLSLDELENRDYEISTLAQNIKEDPVPEELKKQVTDNTLERARAQTETNASLEMGGALKAGSDNELSL